MAVSTVAIILGALVILTALLIFWTKKDFSGAGVGVLLVGMVLVGLPVWKNISIKGAGFDIQLIKEQLDSTAAAAAEIATEVQQTVAALDTTKAQVSALTSELARVNVLSPARLEQVRRSLATAPRPDVVKLNSARSRLTEMSRRLERP